MNEQLRILMFVLLASFVGGGFHFLAVRQKTGDWVAFTVGLLAFGLVISLERLL